MELNLSGTPMGAEPIEPARKRLHTLLACGLVATGLLCLVAAPVTAAEPSDDTTTTTSSVDGENPEPQVETLARDLEAPWGVAFLPNGDALVTERDSADVRLVSAQQEATTVAMVATIEETEPEGEGGLLGIAVSPAFDSDHHVYLYYTAAEDNRIVRATYQNGELGEQEVILDGIAKGSSHNGGAIAFGPDGMLYAGVGEAGDSALAQDRESLNGKILRMTPQGDRPSDNPFDNLVWSYGHRNVQGLAWDHAGRMYATEFGQDTWDEVNLIEKGNNYGWPEAEGDADESRFVDPLVTWSPADASPSGMAYHDGALWVAGLRGERLWRIPLGTDGTVGTPQALLEGEYGRLRTVAAAPDGNLWALTSNRDGRGNPAADDDRILSLTPAADDEGNGDTTTTTRQSCGDETTTTSADDSTTTTRSETTVTADDSTTTIDETTSTTDCEDTTTTTTEASTTTTDESTTSTEATTSTIGSTTTTCDGSTTTTQGPTSTGPTFAAQAVDGDETTTTQPSDDSATAGDQSTTTTTGPDDGTTTTRPDGGTTTTGPGDGTTTTGPGDGTATTEATSCDGSTTTTESTSTTLPSTSTSYGQVSITPTTAPQTTASGGGSLAYTGSNSTASLTALGVGLLLAGIVLVVVTRSRRLSLAAASTVATPAQNDCWTSCLEVARSLSRK